MAEEPKLDVDAADAVQGYVFGYKKGWQDRRIYEDGMVWISQSTHAGIMGDLQRAEAELAATEADLSVAVQVARERAEKIVKVHDWWASLQVSEFEYFKSIHVPGEGPV